MKKQHLRWHPVPGIELANRACERMLAAAAQAIAARGAFRITLAGGGTPRAAYRLLRDAQADWAAWHVFFGDERCLPPDDPERNSRQARCDWLEHVPIPPAQLHPIAAEHGAQRAAALYADTLRGLGPFDMVLLGLGEDGHTASLFPGRDWGVAAGAPDVLAVFDAPKPPAQRVSLSASRLADTRALLFLVSGESKRAALERWRRGEPVPAAAIAPPGGADVLVEAALLQSAA